LLNGINDKLIHKKKLEALGIQLIFANMSIIIIKHNQMEVNATLARGINHLLVQKNFMDNDGNYVYILGWIPYYYVFENQVVASIKSCSFKVLNHWNTNVVFSIY
jgi:hypothetical protein